MSGWGQKILGLDLIDPTAGAGKVTSVWGDGRAYLGTLHYGVDLRAPKGSPVYAALGGVVTTSHSANDNSAGRHVIVTSQTAVGQVSARYLHLDSVRALKGQVLARGELLGTVGDSYGPSGGSAAPHLHFDMGGAGTVIAAYREVLGQPNPPFPAARSFGTQFPSEPFLPVAYEASALERSRRRGVQPAGSAPPARRGAAVAVAVVGTVAAAAASVWVLSLLQRKA